VHQATARVAHVLEGPAADALAGPTGAHLEGDHRVGVDAVLDAGVEVLGVLAEHDEVDVFVGCLDPWQGHHRAVADVQVEGLAQGDVGRTEALALRRHEWPLEAQAIAPHRCQCLLGHGRAVLCDGTGSAGSELPVDGGAGCGEHTAGGAGDLGADAIALDEGDAVSQGCLPM